MTGEGGLRLALVQRSERCDIFAPLGHALAAQGHRVASICGIGPLEPIDAVTKRPRLTAPVAMNLLASGLRFGRNALRQRLNTCFAFDFHSRLAGARLEAVKESTDVVIQHGALFAPGSPPSRPYVLYLDEASPLSEEPSTSANPEAFGAAGRGLAWHVRQRVVLRSARAIAAVSQSVADSVIRDHAIPANRVHVVGVGANLHPERVERRDDGETILFVGRDFRGKGGEVLLRAFDRIRKRRPSARLVIAGPRHRLLLPPEVTQLGDLPIDRLARFLSSSTILAVPALHDAHGSVFLDAMACGVPCVGSRVGIIPEIIDDGETGLLVPRRNDVALAEALLSLLNDRARARFMGMRGREKVERRGLWTHVARRMEAMIRESALIRESASTRESASSERLLASSSRTASSD